MPTHIVFVSDFGDDCIEVSDRLPKNRPSPIMQGVWRGYALTRLRIEADVPPMLPEGDLTEERYREWRSIFDLDNETEEAVDRMVVGMGLGGICLDVRLEVVDFEVIETALVATVKNIGPYPAGQLKLFWHGRWEAQEIGALTGQGFGLVSIGTQPKVLQPGESQQFALIKPNLQKALSFAAALSSDKFWLAVNASLPGQYASHEIYKWPGRNMEPAIEALERFLATESPQ
jgi:hypothetical protein